MKTILSLCALLAVLSVCGCGPAQHPDDEDTTTTTTPDPTPPTPEPVTINRPYQLAASNDLTLFMCHVHQDFYADPVHFSFWWDVKSTFSTAIPSLDWKIERLDGTPQPALTGTITDVAAFNPGIDGHGYFAQWIEQQPGARHQYRLSINPTHAITETAYQNNEYIFEVDVPDRVVASVAGDLEYELDESHVHVMMPDSEYGFHFVAHNRLAAAIPATRWRLQDEVEGIDQSHDLPAIAADGTEEAEQDAVLTVPGLHIVTITIDSTNLVSETNEDNNVSTFYIIVGSPLGDG